MILLDTHVVVWLADAPEMLSPRATGVIKRERRGTGLAIADKTLWELAMLLGRGKLTSTRSVQDFLREVEATFHVLPITADIAMRSIAFSDRYPKDPADRLIGATALAHNLSLITKDTALHASGEVQCIW